MENSEKPVEVVEAAETPPAVVNSSKEEEKIGEHSNESTAEDHGLADPSLVKEGEELALAAASVTEAKEDNNLPKSDEAVAEPVVVSREPEAAELEEKSRSTSHHPPFAAFSAGTRASWTDCCGLLDVFKRSNH